jgi:hypothetical protein
MNRDLKNLGLVLVTVFAMSAVVAPAASATAFTSPEASGGTTRTVLTGSQEGSDVYTTDGGTVACTTINYVGEALGTSATELEVVPTYSGCTAFGFVNVPIDVNGCKFKFTSVGETHIECPSGKAIEWTTPGCTITYGTQTPTGPNTIEYTDIGSGTTRELTIDGTLRGIHYIEDNKGAFPACSNPGVTKSNGTYSGHVKITGETTGTVHTGILWDA